MCLISLSLKSLLGVHTNIFLLWQTHLSSFNLFNLKNSYTPPLAYSKGPNKMDELGNMVKNKARLVTQGYNQEEGIDFDKTFALVARIEAIRLLLAFACHMNFKLF